MGTLNAQVRLWGMWILSILFVVWIVVPGLRPPVSC